MLVKFYKLSNINIFLAFNGFLTNEGIKKSDSFAIGFPNYELFIYCLYLPLGCISSKSVLNIFTLSPFFSPD